MNKFTLFIVVLTCFLSSKSINAQGYTYIYDGSGAASDVNNWVDQGYTPPDFQQDEDIFDCNGYSLDLAGMTIGWVTFTNNSNTTATYTNSGTVTVVSNNAPVFSPGTNSKAVFSFGTAGTFLFSSSASGEQTLTKNTTFYNVSVSGNNKILGPITINGALSDVSSSGLTLNLGSSVIFGSNSSFSIKSNTKFNLTGATSSLFFTDNRSTKTYPGLWSFNNSATSRPPRINSGTYEKLDVQYSYSLDGNVTVTNTIDLTKSSTYLTLNGKTLTITGTANTSSSGVYLKGSSTSSLVCGATCTIYFNQSGTDNYLKNFTINNSKIVTLGNTLNISGGTSGNYGTVIVDTLATCSTGNNLVLKSTSGGTARIGQSSGTIAQEYTVEQYINAERDYRFLASPVVGGTALELRDNAPATPTSGRGIHITGSGGSSSSFDNTLTNKPSAFWFDESKAGDITTIGTTSTATDDPGYTAFTSGGSSYSLTNGLGYRIFVRGDRTIDLSASPAPTPNPTTIWVKGEYPGYSCTLSVSNSNRSKTNDGINFLGNPYPSAIDWNLVTRSNVNNGYMVYDYQNNAFVGYNGSTGDAGQYISSGQGFFVYCNSSSGGNIKIHERCKADQVGGSFFQQKITNHLKVNLMYDSSYNSNTHIHFLEGMSNHFDQADIPQMVNNGTNIATLDSARFPYYINTLGALDSFESIPLSVQGTPAAKLKLSFFDIASFYNHKIQLVDTYNKTTTDIVEGLIYPFEITSDSMSYKNGRFYLNFSKSELMRNAIITSSLIAKISPNPIQNNEIHITLDKKYQDAQFRITNVTGQLIMEGKIRKDKIIDAKSLAKGIYFIGITSNGTSQTIQIIK